MHICSIFQKEGAHALGTDPVERNASFHSLQHTVAGWLAIQETPILTIIARKYEIYLEFRNQEPGTRTGSVSEQMVIPCLKAPGH